MQATTESIPVSPYDSFPCSVAAQGFGFDCIPQASSIRGVDGLPEIITFQPHYRNFGSHESMVFSFVTDVTGENLSGIRWIEMRKTPTTEWGVHQEGTFAPDDGLHRFMSGVAMDGLGNIALAYLTSGVDDFVDVRITGRLASDPLGQMTVAETIIVEGQNPINGGRSGDYSHLTIDPVDDITFWFTAEYADRGSSTTRITSFLLQRPDFDLLPTAVVEPTAMDLTDSENVVVEVANGGSNRIDSYSIGYILDNNPAVIDQITEPLDVDATFVHEFAERIDLSAEGNHILKVFTTSSQDDLLSNDTLTQSYFVRPARDAELLEIESLALNCGTTEAELTIRIRNVGTQILSNVTGTYSLNGGTDIPFNFDTNLFLTQIADFPISISGLVPGRNSVEVSIDNVNGTEDRFEDNNTQIADNIFLGSESITVRIDADGFPNETSWEITDLNGALLFTGGPYDDVVEFGLIEEEVCLLEGECYIFTIFDAFGDGLTNDPDPPGSYSILNSDGEQLAGIINANFGLSEDNEFCASEVCNLDFEVVSQNPTGGFANGNIMINILSGSGLNLYSIDGGQTFQLNPFFTFIGEGVYDIVVRDQRGCSFTATETLGAVATENTASVTSSKIFPNPTNGIFNVELTGYTEEAVNIPVILYNLEGKIIQRTRVTRYGETHKGMISLHNHPEGIYYMRFEIENKDLLLSVTKQ